MARFGMMRVVAVTATTLALGLGGSGAAHATYGPYWNDYTADCTKIRSAPSLSATIVDCGYPGNGAYDFCYKNGDSVFGDGYWDFNYDGVTYPEKFGYTSEYYLKDKSQNKPC